MTAVIDAALERFVQGPAPYSSGNPAPSYLTAQQELAAAFEGQAPHFSKTIAEKLGPQLTDELAKVIRRAVAVGIKRRAQLETAELVSGAYELLVAGLDQVTDGCTTPGGRDRCVARRRTSRCTGGRPTSTGSAVCWVKGCRWTLGTKAKEQETYVRQQARNHRRQHTAAGDRG